MRENEREKESESERARLEEGTDDLRNNLCRAEAQPQIFLPPFFPSTFEHGRIDSLCLFPSLAFYKSFPIIQFIRSYCIIIKNSQKLPHSYGKNEINVSF